MQVACTLPTVEVYSQSLGPADYPIIEDPVWLIPLGSPENVPLNNAAFVQVCGNATNIKKDDVTFAIIAEQYVSATKKPEVFPVCCHIPDTSRFQKYKPVPAKTMKRFIVNVDQVILCQSVSHRRPEAVQLRSYPELLKFTGFFGSQDPDKSEEPRTKKHKTAGYRVAEEVNDKGEGPSSGRHQGGRTTH
ncbi:hypothetical protein MVEN_02319700 [Mycena venus]|uniref:Uncharacterized protein n=1 Tax=Mycena venus TaxID=2733690 RepID=A0A8H7CG15_9AGAR|nr:hypothetical protein MVEN_02319700 [Mycena venus]